jgi:DUF1680 family protein
LLSSAEGGYLNTHYLRRMPENLARLNPGGYLYCLGHLTQAAIAYYRAVGEKKLLDISTRYIDNVIEEFGYGKQQCWSGHPEIEMALVELYRTTGERKYLNFADYLLNGVDLRRVAGVSHIDFPHSFTGIPFKSREELSDHAVCAMYACCGATDYYLETGDKEMWRTLERLWNDLTRYKMYVTGGLGSRPSEEAIGSRYELPNERAYAETCAAIGSIMWNWRLLSASGEARFADIMELALYNGFLSGVSLEGDSYFYWNPLSSRADVSGILKDESQTLIAIKKTKGIGLNTRQPYFNTPCCIPNAQRMIASLPGYIYSTSPEGIWVHLYHSSRLDWHLENGKELTLVQSTKYPWGNIVEIALELGSREDFSLFIRIPNWTPGAKITVNGESSSISCNPGQYCEIRRTWLEKSKVHIEFDMPVNVVLANPRVRENLGSVAIQRGPIVYCLESPDHGDVSIFDIVLPLDFSNTSESFEAEFEPDLLGGIVALRKSALAYESSLVNASLYSRAAFPKPTIPVKITAIPYYAWANRGTSDMEVWVPWIEGK